jgi:1-acyl-sn-glycerol-3-phosphate acyltransferase
VKSAPTGGDAAGLAAHGEANEAGGAPRRVRPPRSRISPERLAAERGGAREGLAWLGRAPEARASLFYRATRLLARAILFGVFRFRIETAGQELLPRGGFLLVAAAHRGWMDPFLVIHALPVEPRAWFLGSGPSTFTSPQREWLIRKLGGLLPVWRGGVGIERHVAAAQAVVGNGAVFAQMPEGTVSGPPGRLGPFRHGAGVIALRTGAAIVPLAMAGTEELYIGKRMASRLLAPTSVGELLGPAWDGRLPEQDTREELELARRVTEALAARLGPVVEALHPLTMDPPSRARRLRPRLTWLFLRPGPLDRS